MAEGISSIIKSLSLTGDMIQMMNESRSRQEEATSAATRGFSLRSGAQQHLELKEMALAVIVPLKNGLHSFNNVSRILLGVKENMVLPKTQTFHDIRREILNMKQQMETSESVATRELLRLDGQTESLTAEQGSLARQKRQKECELKNLETQLESHKSSLEDYKEALKTETRNLDSAEETLRKMKQRRNEAETKRDVGVALMFIPVAGWIVGPPLALAGVAEMDQASDAVKKARLEVQNCESEVDSHADNVYEYKSLVRKAKTDIKNANYKIHQTEANLRDLSEKRMVVADIQAKMRRAVHHLGVLCGVGNVAELQTRRQVLLEPVMTVMDEMTAALGQITGDELLHTEGIVRLMCDMKKNQRKLEQLAFKSSEAYCDYY